MPGGDEPLGAPSVRDLIRFCDHSASVSFEALRFALRHFLVHLPMGSSSCRGSYRGDIVWVLAIIRNLPISLVLSGVLGLVQLVCNY